MADPVTHLAPAKLNLALAVGPPDDASGLHPICSWMVTIDLYDELVVTRLPEGSLSRYAILWHEEARQRSDIDWSITKDLTVRAHQALERHAGRPLPLQLKLDKRIPVGGGLGGGSSDAAAMLRAVNDLFELDLSLDELARIGAELGSDVPFLVHGGSAIVEGFGGQLERHATEPSLHAVVVLPDARCPTAAVYATFDEGTSAPLRHSAVRELADTLPGAPPPDALFNDLTGAAVQIAPSVADALESIRTVAERPAHVSGSGSSLFVVCDDPLHAQALADAVEQRVELPALAVRAVRAVASGYAEA